MEARPAPSSIICASRPWAQRRERSPRSSIALTCTGTVTSPAALFTVNAWGGGPTRRPTTTWPSPSTSAPRSRG